MSCFEVKALFHIHKTCGYKKTSSSPLWKGLKAISDPNNNKGPVKAAQDRNLPKWKFRFGILISAVVNTWIMVRLRQLLG